MPLPRAGLLTRCLTPVSPPGASNAAQLCSLQAPATNEKLQQKKLQQKKLQQKKLQHSFVVKMIRGLTHHTLPRTNVWGVCVCAQVKGCEAATINWLSSRSRSCRLAAA